MTTLAQLLKQTKELEAQLKEALAAAEAAKPKSPRWTDEDMLLLRILVERGVSDESIAGILVRSPKAVQKQRIKQGLTSQNKAKKQFLGRHRWTVEEDQLVYSLALKGASTQEIRSTLDSSELRDQQIVVRIHKLLGKEAYAIWTRTGRSAS